jgi:hypothetical protein
MSTLGDNTLSIQSHTSVKGYNFGASPGKLIMYRQVRNEVWADKRKRIKFTSPPSVCHQVTEVEKYVCLAI